MSGPRDIIQPDPENPNFEHDAAERARLQALLKEAKELLRGRGTCLVILMTTVTDTGCTAMLSEFDGDWYAQNGAMRYALKKREANAHLEAEDQHHNEE